MEPCTLNPTMITPHPLNNRFVRRIGRTTYKVSVAFSETCRETMEDKILRMIQHEVLDNAAICDIIGTPQMSCAVERSN